MKFQLRILPNEHSICRYDGQDPFEWSGRVTNALRAKPVETGLWSLTRTTSEWSLVCETSCRPSDVRAEGGWRVIAVEAQMDLDIVGVLASLLAPLKNAGLSIFAVSTFDTDFVMVRSENPLAAVQALRESGYEFLGDMNFLE